MNVTFVYSNITIERVNNKYYHNFLGDIILRYSQLGALTVCTSVRIEKTSKQNEINLANAKIIEINKENTIKNIKGSIDWVSKKVGGLFKGSMVVGLTDVNLSSSGYGLSTNSVSSDNRTYNTFNVQGGAGQDVSNLARAIRREFDLGRA